MSREMCYPSGRQLHDVEGLSGEEVEQHLLHRHLGSVPLDRHAEGPLVLVRRVLQLQWLQGGPHPPPWSARPRFLVALRPIGAHPPTD